MSFRNWFGLRCALDSCAGRIDHDQYSVFWQCSECLKRDRADSKGDHWEPLPFHNQDGNQP